MSQPSIQRSRYRVLIIEDHALFAESLDLALTLEGYDVQRLERDQLSASPASVLAAVRRIAPRLVLLDLDLGPFGDSVRLIRPLAESGANVVVVTATANRARWGECLYLGARTVMSKTRPLNDILAVTRRLNQGLPVTDVVEREHLLDLFRRDRAEHQDIRDRLDLLTPREQQVLGLLMTGAQVHDIAQTGFVSEATVRTQVKAILAKLDVSSQLSAVGLAHRVGWHAPLLEVERPRGLARRA